MFVLSQHTIWAVSVYNIKWIPFTSVVSILICMFRSISPLLLVMRQILKAVWSPTAVTMKLFSPSYPARSLVISSEGSTRDMIVVIPYADPGCASIVRLSSFVSIFLSSSLPVTVPISK
jgi:hypothetical protein